MSVLVKEVAANWRKLSSWQESPKSFPDVTALQAGREPPEPSLTRVYLSLPDRPELVILEVRDWLAQNAMGKCALHGRFQFEVLDYRVAVDLLGVTYDFQMEEDAFFFKMRWF